MEEQKQAPVNQPVGTPNQEESKKEKAEESGSPARVEPEKTIRERVAQEQRHERLPAPSVEVGASAKQVKNGLKLSQIREAYRNATAKVSEINRQLCFAGIALIWIFKSGEAGQQVVPPELFWPSIYLVSALGCDLLHYIARTFAWGIYGWMKDTPDLDLDTLFRPWRVINWPGNVLFYLKVGLTLLAYMGILNFLLDSVLTVNRL